jgi:hypothetical protein
VEAHLLTPNDVAALDASLTDGDWPLVQALWHAGVSNKSIYGLLRLRAAHRQQSPATDGLEADPHARFARWLVATGRLNEDG